MTESLNKKFAFNLPQLMSALNKCNQETNLSSRAIGKSTRIGERFQRIAITMPRSTNVITQATFSQALTITLLPVFSALNRLGWIRNIHYVVGTKPPATWKDLPFEAPVDWSRFITFKTGAGWHISSQDREGLSRGRNIDSITGDEMLTQDRDIYEQEILPSNRGNDDIFGKNPLHHSIYLTSSMPTGIESQWLLDHAKYYETDGVDIWTPWRKLCALQLQLIDSDDNSEIEQLIPEIIAQRRQIKYYATKYYEDGKEKTRIFTMYNIFENLKNVGIGYTKNMRRQMTDLGFRLEVLNEPITQVENGFYKLTEQHLYTKYDYSFIDSLDYDLEKLKVIDSRRDGDVMKLKPLHIAIDYGAVINAGWIVQPLEEETRWLNSIFVKHPYTVEDWVNNMCDYYTHHRDKTVLHWHDHTALGRDNRYQIRTAAQFRKRGWTYVSKYIGHTPDPEDRYNIWDVLLTGKSAAAPKQRFNKDNCKDGLLSMKFAGVRQGERGFKKDKRSEQNNTLPREQATDFSDAADILVYGLLKDKVRFKTGAFLPTSK